MDLIPPSYSEVSISDTQEHPLGVYLEEESLYSWLGIPIFSSDFWDLHRKRNSDSIFDSEDSGRKIFF